VAAEGVHHQGRAVALALSALALVALEGCASHSERTAPVRSALDVGDPRGAIALLDKEMEVQTPEQLPKDMSSDNALFVLDRGSIQQSVASFDRSKADFEAADKAVDMLDLAHDAKDTIGTYVFSGSSGKYQAPPYEKLLVNTLDMINYLEQRDLNGARVEARRLAVMQKYISDDLKEKDNAVLGLGGFLAGFTFEKSDNYDEALRWYDQALPFTGFRSLQGPIRDLLPKSSYRSPRLQQLEGGVDPSVPYTPPSNVGGIPDDEDAQDHGGEADGPPSDASADTGAPPATPAPPPTSADPNGGDIIFVVGYGRVPHKIAHRIPIGLALTWMSGALAPGNVAAANRLAAQGLVTWINYPTLGRERGTYAIPAALLDGKYVQLEEAVNVTEQVRWEWKKIEGKIIVSAITRMISRLAIGTVAGAIAGQKNGLVGMLVSLGAQATLTALDTPDTRSWETLPARVAIARVHVPAGQHTVHLDARGVRRDVTVDVDKGGWSVVSLMALR
jgi:hypothetical protein